MTTAVLRSSLSGARSARRAVVVYITGDGLKTIDAVAPMWNGGLPADRTR